MFKAHFIIAKFKDRDDTERLLPEIKELFNETLEIPGALTCYKVEKERVV